MNDAVDDIETFLFTSESVGEGHPGKYWRFRAILTGISQQKSRAGRQPDDVNKRTWSWFDTLSDSVLAATLTAYSVDSLGFNVI